MFRITGSKGFQITFENGWTVSVQFGGGNYCENKHIDIGKEGEKHVLSSQNAECAAWNSNDQWLPLSEYDDVIGWQTPEQVLELMNRVAAFTPDYVPPKRKSFVDELESAN